MAYLETTYIQIGPDGKMKDPLTYWDVQSRTHNGHEINKKSRKFTEPPEV